MYLNRLTLIAAILPLLLLSAFGQSPSSRDRVADMYTQHYREAYHALKGYIVQADQSGSKMELRQEMLARTKLVHRLGEEAFKESNHQLETTGKSNTVLLLVSDGCEQLGAAMGSLQNYLDTQDRTFLRISKAAESIAEEIDQSL